MNLTDSDWDLCRHLIDALYAMPPEQRRTAHWVMDRDWARRIDAIRIAGIDPVPSWAYLRDKVLYGKPVKVTPGGGEPHMEAASRDYSKDCGHPDAQIIRDGEEPTGVHCDACGKSWPLVAP